MKVLLSECQLAISQTHGCEAGAVSEIVDIVLSQDDRILMARKSARFRNPRTPHCHPVFHLAGNGNQQKDNHSRDIAR